MHIRHLLTIEIPSLETSNSIGLIIGKLPKRQFEYDENNFSIVNELTNDNERITYKIRIKKESYPLDGEIPTKLDIDSYGLKNLEINSIEISLEQLLEIKWQLISKIMPWREKKEQIKNTIKRINYEKEKIKEKMNIKIKRDEPIFKEGYDDDWPKRFIKFDEDFLGYDKERKELTPSVNTDLFLCEYKICIKFELNEKVNSTSENELVIDFYTFKPKIIDDFLKHYFNEKENSSFNSPDG